MNRKEFLKDLRRALEHLPFEERENAISYYEEYLDDAGPEEEAAAIRGFGSPASIAVGLRAEQAISVPPKTPKEGTKNVWLVILAIFAAPIALIPAIVVIVLAFALFVVLFAFGVTAIALVGGGIVSVIAAFGVLITDFSTFLFFLGGGAALVGLGIVFCFLSYRVATKLMGGFARFLGRFLNRKKRGT